MKTQVQVAVIGGGLIGCSILYHLTKLGWKDVVLLERSELTAGSTWHAAANVHGLHDNNNISRLQYYTMKLYKELEQETGQGCGVITTGSLYLARTPEREHQLRIQAAKARYFGVDFMSCRGRKHRICIRWSILTVSAASCSSRMAAVSIHPG
ncbi:MAG: FAD-dependent oxidoreductase [Thiolinea sp.]